MRRWLWLLLSLLLTTSLQAHEVRPAYIEISEHDGGRADMLWKQPSRGEVAVALRPRISGGLIDRMPDQIQSAGGFGIARWRNLDLAGKGLNGREIRIEGLERTITDALVVIRLANGDSIQRILTPSSPAFVIDTHAGAAVGAYLLLGIQHILTGIDHLLFVLGLILLAARLRALVTTITAFTIAHSITLALTALRLLRVNAGLVEAMVALSILFLAVELVRKYRGEDGMAIRYPWIIAFGFGLLHGAAFAGALRDIGLPEGNIPGALFLFNLGVEAGQLLFVLAVMALLLAVRQVRVPERAIAFARSSTTYAIGSFSMYWFLDRLYVALTAAA